MSVVAYTSFAGSDFWMAYGDNLDNHAIGQRIRYGRERLGLTRGQMAELVGLSEYYLGQLERGERQMSLPVLTRIARCLHLSLDYIVVGKKEDPPKIGEDLAFYDATRKEMECLLNGCTTTEIKLFLNLLKLLVPYVRR